MDSCNFNPKYKEMARERERSIKVREVPLYLHYNQGRRSQGGGWRVPCSSRQCKVRSMRQVYDRASVRGGSDWLAAAASYTIAWLRAMREGWDPYNSLQRSA